MAPPGPTAVGSLLASHVAAPAVATARTVPATAAHGLATEEHAGCVATSVREMAASGLASAAPVRAAVACVRATFVRWSVTLVRSPRSQR